MLRRVRARLAASAAAEILVTGAPGEEPRLVRRALNAGCDTIIALGGDGTWSNVANAILATGGGADIRLALLAAGTGNDFAKTVGAPVHDIAETIRLATEGADVLMDVGRVEDSFFLNIVGFGVDVAVLENVANVRWLTGDALYFYAGLREIFRYGGLNVAIDSDGRDGTRARRLILLIANARNFGGVFRLAPHASTVDGQLDAVAIGDAAPLRRLQLFLAAARGAHTQEPEVKIVRAPRFRLRFDSPPAYEIDGEYRVARSRDLEVSCVPRAVRIVTPLDETALAGTGATAGRPAAAGADGPP